MNGKTDRMRINILSSISNREMIAEIARTNAREDFEAWTGDKNMLLDECVQIIILDYIKRVFGIMKEYFDFDNEAMAEKIYTETYINTLYERVKEDEEIDN